MSNAPVVIFLYNRPYQTINTINYLKKNSLCRFTDLIIFSDGFKKNKILDKKKVEIVRYIIKNVSGFKSKKIFFRNKNFGLFKNITNGLDYVFKKYDKAIILEDDIIVNKFFLNYMNKALKIYQDDKKVSSVHGWFCEHNKKVSNTFFLRGSDIWGWATWKKNWKEFNRNPKNLLSQFNKNPDLIEKFNLLNSYNYFGLLKKRALKLNESWGILWNASNFLKGKLYLNFSNSLCINIGQDRSGTHISENDSYFNQKLNNKKIKIIKQEIKENLLGEKIKSDFFKKFYNNKKLKKISYKLIYKIFQKKVNRKKKISFIGPLNNWKEAENESKGYDSRHILKNVLKNTIISNNNLYFFERDGFLLKKNTIPHNQLYLILENLSIKKRGLNIVDFGGSLGSVYFKMKDIIDINYKNNWNIIEQEIFVKTGKKNFKKNNLNFFDNLKNIRNKKIDILILSGSLQYMKEPEVILEKIFKLKPKFILIERTPISYKQKKNEIFIQKKAENSYPSWNFSNSFLKSLFRKNSYRLIENLSSEFDHNIVLNNQRIYYGGYIYKLSSKK